jgi:hypothetical protein
VNRRTLAVGFVIALALVCGTGLGAISQDQADGAGGAPLSITPLNQPPKISPTDVA